MNPTIWATLFSVAMVGVGIGDAVSLGRSSFKLRLLHTNDMHARFEQVSQTTGKCSEEDAARNLCYGGFARVQAALADQLEKAKKENVSVLSLNAGDTYQGTAWYTIFKWRVVSHFLKKLSIDAMALGNHEFDDGIKGLTPFLSDVRIPNLVANIDSSEEPEMARAPIKKYMLFERGGKKIGVIGYLTPDTVTLADVGKLKFKDEITSLTEEVSNLKKEGVDIIIALGHSGYEMDLKIAAQVPDVDVVVGGHSHTFLYTGSPPDIEKPADKYPVLVTQKSGRKVAMVQAYAYTKYLGILDLTFDERGELFEAKGNPILLDHRVTQDPDILREVNEWRLKLNATLSEVIGRTKVILDASACRFDECNLGNLITDAYIHYGVKSHSGPNWTKVAIAIQQAGGIRTTINATATGGMITREDLLTTMPFFSPLSVVRIKGKYLQEALEWSVARYDVTKKLGRGEFLQVSGLKVKFDVSRPLGSRVVSLQVRCQLCQIPRFEPFMIDANYTIVMPTFLLNGGDNFTMFKEHGVEIEKFKHSDTETVIQYLQERGILYNGVEDRLEINSGFNLKPTIIQLVIFFNLIKFLI